MITFKSPIWDALIEFIDKLRQYPAFEVMEAGRYKNRVEQIYNRAVDRMRLDKTDLDLISSTFVLLGDKNVGSDIVEYMNECSRLGYKCVTSADGEKIIREAEAVVKQRHRDEELKLTRDIKKKEYDEAKAKYDEYMATQENIISKYEKAKIELDEYENKCKDLAEKPVTAEDVKAEDNQ